MRKSLLGGLISFMAFMGSGCSGSENQYVHATDVQLNQLAHLVFAVQPVKTTLGQSIPTFRVEGRDQNNQPIQISAGNVEIKLGNNPSGASLLDNGNPVSLLSSPVSNGAASFSTAGLNKAGQGYTLIASYTVSSSSASFLAPDSSTSLTVTSDAFAVVTQGVSSAYFVRSHESLWDPEGGDADNASMDAAFGAGNWTLAYFEDVNTTNLLGNSDRVIFMDGSDNSAIVFADFLNSNASALQSYVNGGGRLILNSAPNTGGDITTPFEAQIILDFPEDSVKVEATHPIGQACNGILDYTGDSYAHAHVVGTDLTPIISGYDDRTKNIVASDRVVLAEKSVGSGLLLVGGLTTPNFQEPNQPDQANNLRANILRYAGGFSLVTTQPIVGPKLLQQLLPSSSRH